MLFDKFHRLPHVLQIILFVSSQFIYHWNDMQLQRATHFVEGSWNNLKNQRYSLDDCTDNDINTNLIL